MSELVAIMYSIIISMIVALIWVYLIDKQQDEKK